MFFWSRRFMGNAVCCIRFTARGQVRSRRTGLGLSRISSTASRVAAVSLRGGKGCLAGNLAADNPGCADEGPPVRIKFGLIGCLAHKVPYSVVSQWQAPYLLLHKFRLP
jgi:hypothetical protein